jgi:hypothetical protein
MKNFFFVIAWRRQGVFLFIIILISTFSESRGQSVNKFISGFIRDSEKKLGLAYVSVGIDKTTIGVISNEEGAFKLIIPTEHLRDTLFVSSIGYKQVRLPLNDSIFLKPIEVFLDENTALLKEVIVTAKGTSPFELLQDAARITNERSYSPTILHTYYREFIKKNSSYTKYSDAMIDYYLPSLEKWSRRSAIEVRVNESRSKIINIPVDSGLDINLTQIIHLRILPSYCNTSRIVRYFSKKGTETDYNFSVSEDASNGTYSLIIVPKEGIKKTLYSGKIIIDKETMTIMSADIEIPPSYLTYTDENILGIHVKVEKFKMNIQYQLQNGKCFIKHMKVDVVQRAYNHKKTNVVTSFISEFVINRIDYDTIKPFKKEEIFKGNSLYKSGTSFQNEFWVNQNGLVPTKEEDFIINSLDKKSP